MKTEKEEIEFLKELIIKKDEKIDFLENHLKMIEDGSLKKQMKIESLEKIIENLQSKK